MFPGCLHKRSYLLFLKNCVNVNESAVVRVCLATTWLGRVAWSKQKCCNKGAGIPQQLLWLSRKVVVDVGVGDTNKKATATQGYQSNDRHDLFGGHCPMMSQLSHLSSIKEEVRALARQVALITLQNKVSYCRWHCMTTMRRCPEDGRRQPSWPPSLGINFLPCPCPCQQGNQPPSFGRQPHSCWSHTVTVTVTVDSFSTPPVGYTTSKIGQIFARTQGPELSLWVALFRN